MSVSSHAPGGALSWICTANPFYVISAGLLRGIGLNLPAGYRVPYYRILALFFGYPLALCPYLSEPNGGALRWGMFSFSSVAGLVFLTLLPAIRRGGSYVADNGSPWP